MNIINVVAAVIVHHDRYLCAQRAVSKYDYLSFKYEFPGGKIEPSESNEEALHREIQEELGVNIKIYSIIDIIEHQYQDFKVKITFYNCKFLGNQSIDAKEHKCIKWCLIDEMEGLDWADADKPIIQLIKHRI